MKTPPLASSALAASAVLTAINAHADAVDELVAKIKSSDDKVRGPAWQSAATVGVPAIKPLATAMLDPDFEVARSAKRATWIIVRHAGRPGAEAERKAAQAVLILLLQGQPAPVRKEALWMLSEIGDKQAVEPMAVLLTDGDVREDARCALTRLPFADASRALQKALKTAPADFQPALAESLRLRGGTVTGVPTQKLKPAKQTSLQPTAAGTSPSR